MLSKEELIEFEQNISDIYCDGKIKAPIHLSDGNEDELIQYFKHAVDCEHDWVFTTWRSHYHCLLKEVPREKVKAKILAGHSITLNFPEHKVFSSAIVGGIIPIAMGTALGINRRKALEHDNNDDTYESRSKVHCFVGDMTAETGGFYECLKYSYNHKLPIHFIIEDNHESVGTPTDTVWGYPSEVENINDIPYRKQLADWFPEYITYYEYDKKWPHVGSGKWIVF